MDRLQEFFRKRVFFLIGGIAVLLVINGLVALATTGDWTWLTVMIAWIVVITLCGIAHLKEQTIEVLHETIELNHKTIELQDQLIKSQQQSLDYLRKQEVL